MVDGLKVLATDQSIIRIFKLTAVFCCILFVSFSISIVNFPFSISNPIHSFNISQSIRLRNCTVVLHNPLGRLGNVLFEFASAYGLSLEHKCRLYIGPEVIKELEKSFRINISNSLNQSELSRSSPLEQIFNHCTYFPDLFQPNKSQFVELVGYWQAYKHFANQTDRIRDQLRFQDVILNRANSYIGSITNRTNISKSVGIHIRRGDFVNARTISSEKFIYDAMDYFIKKYRFVNFLFASDDKPYCQRTFSQRNNTFVMPDSFSPAEDMAVLTLCNDIIITVGTYSWWSAFLLQNRTGEVITDSKLDHSPLDVDCQASVFFPSWFKFLN